MGSHPDSPATGGILRGSNLRSLAKLTDVGQPAVVLRWAARSARHRGVPACRRRRAGGRSAARPMPAPCPRRRLDAPRCRPAPPQVLDQRRGELGLEAVERPMLHASPHLLACTPVARGGVARVQAAPLVLPPAAARTGVVASNIDHVPSMPRRVGRVVDTANVLATCRSACSIPVISSPPQAHPWAAMRTLAPNVLRLATCSRTVWSRNDGRGERAYASHRSGSSLL